MNLIFSADKRWGIGKDNRLLFHTPGDMAFFKRMTLERVVVMGRRTLESLPGGKPLPKRANVVLTRDEHFAVPGVTVCHSLEMLFSHLAAFGDEEIFIMGGEQLYRQLLPYASVAYVTRWDARADADSFVPDLEQHPGWHCTDCSDPITEQGITYRFCTYRQDCPQPWRQAKNNPSA